jgi:hypothetical protein
VEPGSGSLSDNEIDSVATFVVASKFSVHEEVKRSPQN